MVKRLTYKVDKKITLGYFEDKHKEYGRKEPKYQNSSKVYVKAKEEENELTVKFYRRAKYNIEFIHEDTNGEISRISMIKDEYNELYEKGLVDEGSGEVKVPLLYVTKQGKYRLTYKGSDLYNEVIRYEKLQKEIKSVDIKKCEIGQVYLLNKEKDDLIMYLGEYYVDKYIYSEKDKVMVRELAKEHLYMLLNKPLEQVDGEMKFVDVEQRHIDQMTLTNKGIIRNLYIESKHKLYIKEGFPKYKVDMEKFKSKVKVIRDELDKELSKVGYILGGHKLKKALSYKNDSVLLKCMMNQSALKLLSGDFEKDGAKMPFGFIKALKGLNNVRNYITLGIDTEASGKQVVVSNISTINSLVRIKN